MSDILLSSIKTRIDAQVAIRTTDLCKENEKLRSEKDELRKKVERLEQESILGNNDRQRLTDGYKRLSADYAKLYNEWCAVAVEFGGNSLPKSPNVFKFPIVDAPSLNMHNHSTSAAHPRIPIIQSTPCISTPPRLPTPPPFIITPTNTINLAPKPRNAPPPPPPPKASPPMPQLDTSSSVSTGCITIAPQLSGTPPTPTLEPKKTLDELEPLSEEIKYILAADDDDRSGDETSIYEGSDSNREESESESESDSHDTNTNSGRNSGSYACDICGKSYKRKYNLRNHGYVHTNRWPYRCEHCGKGFAVKYDRMRHRRIHTREKPHECDVCKSTFMRKSTLTAHRRVHDTDRPFKCGFDKCDRSFRRSSDLTNHRKVHTPKSDTKSGAIPAPVPTHEKSVSPKKKC